MTLRTATYNTATHKIVPIECTDDQAEAIAKVVNVCGGIAESIYHSAIAAAPEYRDKQIDLESRDFYEIMQAYRTAILDAALQFEAVKAWLRKPEYKEPEAK
jgi:hypothetical protein